MPFPGAALGARAGGGSGVGASSKLTRRSASGVGRQRVPSRKPQRRRWGGTRGLTSSSEEELPTNLGTASSSSPLLNSSTVRGISLGDAPPCPVAAGTWPGASLHEVHSGRLWSPPHLEHTWLKGHGFFEQGLPSFHA